MTNGPQAGGGAQAFFARLLDFEHLMGAALIKIVYYIGLVGIALWALVALLGSLNAGRYGGGEAVLLGLLMSVVVLVVGTLFWRFTCELWMVMFKIHDRLGDIRERLPAARPESGPPAV
ncbi:MAG TPA: DUF4282 domain-containing protein [Allosphingosinicella sp.]|nr:DUF4282 domain-containing protein [Allosphingosinicella sp.]